MRETTAKALHDGAYFACLAQDFATCLKYLDRLWHASATIARWLSTALHT
jgi:hypothetical protein